MRSIDPNTVATPSESRAEVLRFTGHNYGVVRHVLVQHPRARCASEHPRHACPHAETPRLLLYLLLLTIWPMLAKATGALRAPSGRAFTTEGGPPGHH